METLLGKVSHAISSGKKSGMQGRIASASEEEFDERDLSQLDRLRWRCELDCFELGDQANATRNMMVLIKNTADPVRREQGIRTLRDKLIQSMRKMMPGAEDEMAASDSPPAPRARRSRPPRPADSFHHDNDEPGDGRSGRHRHGRSQASQTGPRQERRLF